MVQVTLQGHHWDDLPRPRLEMAFANAVTAQSFAAAVAASLGRSIGTWPPIFDGKSLKVCMDLPPLILII